MNDQTIICFASNYFFSPTSKHHVMRELAERHHVLWINWHASRRPSLNGRDFKAALHKLRQIRGGLVQVQERLWVMTPLVLPLPNSAIARRLNRWLLVAQTRQALRSMPGKRQLWSFTPDIGNLLGSFGEHVRVYYCVDEFSAFPGYDQQAIRRLDREMCEECDLVFASSRNLLESKRPFNPNTFEIPHGVLYQHFSRVLDAGFSEAADLADIPRPRIGYYGLVHEWQDLDRMARLAQARPDWSFVFVGPVQTDLRRFSSIPNMRFLGERPHDDLPRYSRGFDAAIIPHKVNELTLNMNPIKLREYLAAGLPVVSSPLPAVREYEPHVRIAESDEEWIAALENAIADRSPKADRTRSECVSGEDWSVRVEQISRELERVIDAKALAGSAVEAELVPQSA